MKMKEAKTAVKTHAGKENEPVENTARKKTKEEKPPTKVIVRRLPPSMTEEQFKEQVSPMPDHDYFYFVAADMSLMPNAFSRAYINFIDQNDLFIFTEKFDGYVFLDNKGGEFPAVVEFAPFQRIPKNRPTRKKDSKVGTIEADPVYIAFKERLETENLENKTANNVSKQHFFETSTLEKKEEVSNTPLLDFIRNKRAERQRIRDEKREEKRKKDIERRKAKDEQRKVKKEDEPSVVKVLNNSQTMNKERPKEKEVKPSFLKKKPDDGKATAKEKVTVESRSKEAKRTGKSYLEERQRLAERREERKKQGQKSSSTSGKSSSTPDEGASSAAVDDKTSEDVTASATESKGKESDYKKPDRVFKREERRSSYKYEKYDNKRDRDDDSRRPRRGNERSYQGGKRDDERSEDGGRKRYSETRRGHESSQKDRYKDKEKNKGYIQKKNDSVPEMDKKTTTEKEGSDKPLHKNSETKDSENINKADNDITKNSESNKDPVGTSKEDPLGVGSKPTRRKSVDYDKTKSSSSYSKSYSKERFSEKKRRHSMGSSKNNAENEENVAPKNNRDPAIENDKTGSAIKFSEQDTTKIESSMPGSEKSARDREFRKEFEDEQRKIPKRRNSTGGQEPEVVSPRRNSLGSEDKNQVVSFKEGKEDKSKDENKRTINSRDPRTERKIRNKDRPSLEIYRPGMGRFSKQRFEREKEKGLGSSTEVDSPSPSPSPTPQLKHKSLTSNQ